MRAGYSPRMYPNDVDIGFWQAANVYSAMAIQDQITGSKANEAVVAKNLKLVFTRNKNYDAWGYNDDALWVFLLLVINKVVLLLISLAVLSRWWAQAAVYAYKAYNDDELLKNAIATWDSVSR